MARPTNKKDLISASSEQFDKLWELINSIDEKDRLLCFGFEDRDKNIRDVLIHLYEWHQLLLNWVKANQCGEDKSFLPEPYNWKTYPDMNVGFWEKHQNTSYEESVNKLNESHKDVMNLIDKFNDEELFTKKHFSWTGTTSLGSYCVSATSSHYDWAVNKIKKYKKELESK